jgi:hypothetical protein
MNERRFGDRGSIWGLTSAALRSAAAGADTELAIIYLSVLEHANAWGPNDGREVSAPAPLVLPGCYDRGVDASVRFGRVAIKRQRDEEAWALCRRFVHLLGRPQEIRS